MRRQRRTHQHYSDDDDYDFHTGTSYQPLFNGGSATRNAEDFLQMENLTQVQPYRFENTIEAKVEEGDTLQALALRFHCTVADIKRLNKIDKDNEIHARKVVKIPVTVHSVLLGALPEVHKSGNNSPKQQNSQEDERINKNIMRNPLEDARVMLGEKLLVASVNAAGANAATYNNNINNSILNSKNAATSSGIYTDDDPLQSSFTHHKTAADANDLKSPLLSDILLDDDDSVSRIRPIRGPALSAFDCSGSDCDMSWVCLFVIILAVCFLIPLVYVIHLAEHPPTHNITPHHHDALLSSH